MMNALNFCIIESGFLMITGGVSHKTDYNNNQKSRKITFFMCHLSYSVNILTTP